MPRGIHMAMVCALGVAACSGTDLFNFADFDRFHFVRQPAFLGIVKTGWVMEAELVRTSDTSMTMTATTANVVDRCDDQVTDCVSFEEVQRALTRDEIVATETLFSLVTIRPARDAESCALIDPALWDRYTWDDFSVSTNVCQSPHLDFDDTRSWYAHLQALAQ